MLASLGGELNFMATVLINGSNWVLTMGPFIVVAVLVAGGAVLQWRKTEKGGMAFDQSIAQSSLSLGRLSICLSCSSWLVCFPP